MTVSDAAKRLGCSKQHVRTMIWRGNLEASKEEVGQIAVWNITPTSVERAALNPPKPRGVKRGGTHK